MGFDENKYITSFKQLRNLNGVQIRHIGNNLVCAVIPLEGDETEEDEDNTYILALKSVFSSYKTVFVSLEDSRRLLVSAVKEETDFPKCTLNTDILFLNSEVVCFDINDDVSEYMVTIDMFSRGASISKYQETDDSDRAGCKISLGKCLGVLFCLLLLGFVIYKIFNVQFSQDWLSSLEEELLFGSKNKQKPLYFSNEE